MNLSELRRLYARKRAEIEERIGSFNKLRAEGTGEDVFGELAFCLFTPQSRAKNCWAAVEALRKKGLLLGGNTCRVSSCLDGVRFHRNKSRYLLEARRVFTKKGTLCIRDVLARFRDVRELREWLVENVKGLGYKEASHFLRNIGYGDEIAIIDRHILRNLKRFGVIKDIPRAITRKNYLQMEGKMAGFARRVRIPLAHLDLLFWSMETGEVFK